MVGLRNTDVPVVPRQSSRNVAGFIVAFGDRRTSNPGDLRLVTFGPNMIDDNTFEMFFLTQLPTTGVPTEFWARIPRDSVDIIPLKIDALTATGRVTAASEIPVSPGTIVDCNGVGFMWDPELFGMLKGRRIMMQLKGDFIFDAIPGIKPRAVDANFLLAPTLPTGDMVAGGTFWSWFTLL
jgi:hypothetical protein